MSTAAVASTAVESAATAAVESITAVIAAARVAAVVSATDKAVGFATPVAVASVSIATAASVVSTVAIISAVAVVTAATVESAAIVAAVEPRAGADEDAADEVIRAVEAVGCAGVRIVAVVTISAGGSWPDRAVHGTYSNAHGKLCVSASRGKKENSKQCNVF